MWIAVNTVLSPKGKVYRLEHNVRTPEDELLVEVVEINFNIYQNL